MSEHKRPIIAAANWKMNLNWEEAIPLAYDVVSTNIPDGVEVILGVPSVYLNKIAGIAAENPGVSISAQNCHQSASGAFTGEISAGMIRSVGATHVILGHSERRQYFHESNPLLRVKTEIAISSGLKVVFCVGETLEERESGQQFMVVDKQLTESILGFSEAYLNDVIIAYEPVWAIGTGKTASPQQAQEMHAFIRRRISEVYPSLADKMPILYGGSVKPANAVELFSEPDIDGGLIGGASLNIDSFRSIIEAAASI